MTMFSIKFIPIIGILGLSSLGGHSKELPKRDNEGDVKSLVNLPIQTSISAQNIFVARGFDSNDDVEIFVNGYLPNTCYRRPVGEVISKGKGQVLISLTASKIEDPSVLCIMAEVPYMIPISLGKLDNGNHNIAINQNSSFASRSEILIEEPSSSSVDNFTYANVTKVEKVVGRNAVVIEGYHPSSCMDFLSIEVRPNDTGDTYAILPIIRQSEYECDRVVVPFVKIVSLPKLVSNKEVLVLVRKIDGRGISYLLRT